MKKIEIKMATDFSQFPAGRFKTDGEFSAEHFRDDILIPKMKKYDKVIVNFDNTAPYGSSFLEEAFGGLVRKNINNTKLELSSQDNILLKEINLYMNKAEE